MLSSLLQAKYDRHELNEHFFEELDSLRYGDDSGVKQKYDSIGEKFGFWKHLSDAQKRRCILDPWRTIKNKPWNRSNKITISHDDKMEFLEQRWLLDETTCRNLLDRFLNASEADPTRQESIEKPLSDAFADSPLSFDNFHNATRGVPESDLFIRGWFERKYAELLLNRQTAKIGASGSDDLQMIYWQTRHSFSSNPPAFWAVEMCEKVQKIQLAEKAQRALSKKRMINSQNAVPEESSRHMPSVSTMDLCDEIHSPHQSKCVVPKKKGHPSARLVRNVKRRRHQISYGINPIDMDAYDEHFEALHRKRLGENASEDVPSTISSTSSTGDVLEVPPTSSNSDYTEEIQEFVPAADDGIDTRRRMDLRSQSSIDTNAQRNSPSRVEESFGGNATVADMVGVGESFGMNSSSYPIETEFDYETALRSLPYHFQRAFRSLPYSNMLTPAGFGYNQPSTSTQCPIGVRDFYFAPATSGENHTSTSSQVSSPPPNAISTDAMTHQATLTIAPPPRMMESIMKKLSIEMKNREESGSVDFSRIEVDLRATGKELDDSIAFLNNLTAQLEAAKQSGSNQ